LLLRSGDSGARPTRTLSTLNIDNTYFPLPVGRRWVFLGKEQGQAICLRITVDKSTERFYDGQVIMRVVEELEWKDANENGGSIAAKP
jgi:hypothetical protein